MPKVLSDADARTLQEVVSWYKRNKGRLASSRRNSRPMVFGKGKDDQSSSDSDSPSISDSDSPSISDSVSDSGSPSISDSVSSSDSDSPSISDSVSSSDSEVCVLIPGVDFASLPVVSVADVNYVLALKDNCLVLVETAACETDGSTGGGSESTGGGGGGPGGVGGGG